MNKKVLFVDFFDTIMLRHLHPFQITQRWAENLCKKYHLQDSATNIICCRNKCFKKIATLRGETVYSEAMMLVYDTLVERNTELRDLCSPNEFIEFSLATEIALETAVQYPNQKLLRQLHKEKGKGSRIYIVSDFYLSKADLIYFCRVKNIDVSLFDDIFVSSDMGATKSNGTLYKKVLETISDKDVKIWMIGDNYHSDAKMARSNRIRARLYRRLLYKVCLRAKRILQYDFSAHAGKILLKKCYKGTVPFAEYVTVFFSFTERLKANIAKSDKVIFLSREGHFLKRLFEAYDYYVTPCDEQTEKVYFLCSRRAISSTQMEELGKLYNNPSIRLRDYLYSAGIAFDEMPDVLKSYGIREDLLDSSVQDFPEAYVQSIVRERVQKNKQALKCYAEETIGAKTMTSVVNIVDIGWAGSMQAGLEKVLGIKTKGFYLGTIASEKDPVRKGLIFSAAEHEKRTTYFYILNSNKQLYEQLSAAPHGSAQTYSFSEQGPTVPLEWVESEKSLYDSLIVKWQEHALVNFAALSAWKPLDKEMFSNRDNRDVIIRSGLFANKSRRDFLRNLDKGFVWNFGRNKEGTNYNRKGFNVDFSIISSPEKYFRYMVKIQRKLPQNAVVQAAYMVFAEIYAGVVKTVLFFKRAR